MVPPASHRVPRVPWYSGYRPLCPLFAYVAFTLFRLPFQTVLLSFHRLRRSSTPVSRSWPVWALPSSLAATVGISFDFSSSGYLDVSVPRVPLPCGIVTHNGDWVSPFGYPRIYTCLQFPVAFRSLPRPSSASGAKASTVCP